MNQVWKFLLVCFNGIKDDEQTGLIGEGHCRPWTFVLLLGIFYNLDEVCLVLEIALALHTFNRLHTSAALR